MTNAIELLLGGLLQLAFGNPLAVGIISLVLFVIFIVAIKISFEGGFALFMGFIHLVAVFGYLPYYVWYGLLIVDGIILSIAFLRLVGRH